MQVGVLGAELDEDGLRYTEGIIKASVATPYPAKHR